MYVGNSTVLFRLHGKFPEPRWPHLSWSPLFPYHQANASYPNKYFWKDREIERERNSKKLIFHPLFHSPDGHKSQGLARPKPWGKNSTWIFHSLAGAQVDEQASVLFLSALAGSWIETSIAKTRIASITPLWPHMIGLPNTVNDLIDQYKYHQFIHNKITWWYFMKILDDSKGSFGWSFT